MPENQFKLSHPDTGNAIIVPLEVNEITGRGIELFIKREDRIHEFISGNKWRKLKYNLKEAGRKGYNKLLTFGGAYSNHICAVAAAGKLFGFGTIGVIRGEAYSVLNPTLSLASRCGMTLHYVSRKDYAERSDTEFSESLKNMFGEFYSIPEGGSNVYGMKGCAEMVSEILEDFDMICLPCGTGGSLAGMLEGLNGRCHVLGFPVLKDGSFLKKGIDSLTQQYSGRIFENYDLNTDYHFGGYAKYNPPLIDFINGFKKENNILLDPVYTGKMMFGIFDLIRKGRLNNKKILVIHTGGLQGIAGFNQRFGDLIQE